MRAKDIMTPKVIYVGADEAVVNAARLMLQHRISGLPVVDKKGELVGIVTEGDFLRRSELGTQRRRPKWLEFVLGPGKLAHEYVHASGKKIEDVMTPDPWTLDENESLETVVDMMERHRIKRIPVTRDGRVVGIISRANLMHALASLARDVSPSAGDESTITLSGWSRFREWLSSSSPGVSMRQTATASMAVLSGRTSRVPEADHGNKAHQCWAESVCRYWTSRARRLANSASLIDPALFSPSSFWISSATLKPTTLRSSSRAR